jgi:hypothetical protein
MNVDSVTMQAIFELDFQMTVQRRSRKKVSNDRFVLGRRDGA